MLHKHFKSLGIGLSISRTQFKSFKYLLSIKIFDVFMKTSGTFFIKNIKIGINMIYIILIFINIRLFISLFKNNILRGS